MHSSKLVLSLAAAAVASCLQAQSTRDEVVVLGRWDNPVGTSRSASQGVAGNLEIESRPRLRTGEILEVVPGVIVTQHSGSGKSNQMFLRGFNLDHGTDFATFVDGTPVNLPTASRLAAEPIDGVEDYHFHPIEPRTVRAHASWRF